MNLYITHDFLGRPTGAGVVCDNECRALTELDETGLIDGKLVREQGLPDDPFNLDVATTALIKQAMKGARVELAHFYSGTNSRAIRALKDFGAKVSVTVAAHDKKISAEEFTKYGANFCFPHLVNEILYQEYVEGYRMADLVICPSTHSAGIMRELGCKNIKIITHGCHPVAATAPFPQQFTVGYLGSSGVDKGLIYLIDAWNTVGAGNGWRLLLAGSDWTESSPAPQYYKRRGLRDATYLGWVNCVSDFYAQCSVCCQPSSTEGFGIEIAEAMAHGRPVIATTNCGGPDVIEPGSGIVVEARNPEALARALAFYGNNQGALAPAGEAARKASQKFIWDRIREQYHAAWKELLA